ncbi:MAG: FtsH protease activity modulator HflK [Burkholderiales bacterium]
MSDPQWGRRGGSGGGGGNSGGGGGGPPDLDELWRNFNQRLSGMFSRRNGGSPNNPGGSPAPSARQLGGGIGMLLGLVIIAWLASGFFIVDPQFRGVVLQFGKYRSTATEGLNWRIPYPFQSHELVNISQVRNVEVGFQETTSIKRRNQKESLVLTDDENIIDVQFVVNYEIRDPLEFLFNNRNAEDAVKQVAETAIREIIGKSKMDMVLSEGRGKVASDTQKLMQDILDRYKSGILIRRVNLQAAQAPEEVKAAFDDAVRAGQDRERLKNEGEAYANDVLPKARGAAARLLEEANGYRQTVVANAEGEASRFRQVLIEYERAPAVTRERIYIETVQQIMSSSTKVMVDSRQNNNLLMLPLDRLLQMSGAATMTTDGTFAFPKSPAEIPTPPVVEAPARGREIPRNREREAR